MINSSAAGAVATRKGQAPECMQWCPILPTKTRHQVTDFSETHGSCFLLLDQGIFERPPSAGMEQPLSSNWRKTPKTQIYFFFLDFDGWAMLPDLLAVNAVPCNNKDKRTITTETTKYQSKHCFTALHASINLTSSTVQPEFIQFPSTELCKSYSLSSSLPLWKKHTCLFEGFS